MEVSHNGGIWREGIVVAMESPHVPIRNTRDSQMRSIVRLVSHVGLRNVDLGVGNSRHVERGLGSGDKSDCEVAEVFH